MNYIFPETKFVQTTDSLTQLEHFKSECQEIIERIDNGDFTGIIEETLDMIHSAETFLRMAEKNGVDVKGIKQAVIRKNEERGYYPVQVPQTGCCWEGTEFKQYCRWIGKKEDCPDYKKTKKQEAAE